MTVLSPLPDRRVRPPAAGSNRCRTLLLAAVLGLPACAKVGDPLPPIPQFPATIQDLRAVPTATGVELLFTIPAPDIRWVEVHRQCDAKTAGDRIQLVQRLAWEGLRDSGRPGVFTWEDRSGRGRSGCRYALRFINDRGLESEFSNFARADGG